MRVDEYNWKLEQMMDATASGYVAAVKAHKPECLYRDFCLWGVARDNPHRSTVMQLTGALQLAKLVTRLYDAALLVRLQNNIGTGLFTCDNSTRLMLAHKLMKRSGEREDESLVELLVRTGKEYAVMISPVRS